MSKQLNPHKILWLASYPKSGNTWFRAFLTALINDGKVDINQMASDGIFSSRETFDMATDIDSRDLYDDEAKLMVADVYRRIATEKNSLSIIKIHDFFGPDPEGNNLVPGDVTQCAIYFIRNPLDIAASLANHMDFSIGEAINMLNNDSATMANQANNLNKNPQFTQFLSSWSDHVNSWTLRPKFPVCAIRFEDMLADTFNTFSKILNFIGWEYSDSQIKNAITATSFEILNRQETQKGFKEKSNVSPVFFRSGKMGKWQEELNVNQISKIITINKQVMNKYQYTAS